MNKRMKAIAAKLTPGTIYPVEEALKLLKECATAKFKESFDVAINLGIDTKKSDQTVRGAVNLPHGTGKTVRVAVITQAANAKAAQDAGADKVGFEDLAEEIKGGKIDFDILIATPDAMPLVGRLGQILGPKGLMPNPKVGTVTPNVAEAVKNAKAGQVQFRASKDGIVHCAIGKMDFDAKALQENLQVLLAAIKKAKPSASKGTFNKKITVSTTMGPGIMVDANTL
ncbi:MAG: 50S ribosomal protein L1 [Gammaproteobacteria bacterium RIFOXYB2_FULL_38_6]|nr:MAG: 50S ribosomal protein L1 [Gammaproteobacteria bacterium RIFOXYB2_FULL_38_6]